MSEKQPEESLRARDTFSGPAFKYVVLAFSIFLIILGSMSVYEGQKAPIDDQTENIGLIVIATMTLLFTILFLLLLIYVAKMDQGLSFTKLYLSFLLIAFGIIDGAISLVCAVDFPNNHSRGTLLWITGAISVISGVIGTILSILFICRAYRLPGLKGLDKTLQDKPEVTS